ncbi:hypothetical protein [Shewanella fidelis]|uniref:Uncharacterized protein n=1 Tax=Shewanella fidelis TaxID=173509 RepID=A0AAW8NTP3_9GAMM|nr:hypothetical protein [Shewanella fidelis]MDR8525936.1 hypothetical protein [Shewanella fidelis]MDW4813876.1 hypothetical protein [Shewanella fidelis]MDW4817932.1 hypothetical protein [Shewanella fidelis]MDW4821999.1 hypothetical protein [Shewanella fidelis]MDW4826164.1 hypothetical protein [Shewanella fidelis]
MRLANKAYLQFYYSISDLFYLLLGTVMLTLVAVNDWPAVINLLMKIGI